MPIRHGYEQRTNDDIFRSFLHIESNTIRSDPKISEMSSSNADKDGCAVYTIILSGIDDDHIVFVIHTHTHSHTTAIDTIDCLQRSCMHTNVTHETNSVEMMMRPATGTRQLSQIYRFVINSIPLHRVCLFRKNPKRSMLNVKCFMSRT